MALLVGGLPLSSGLFDASCPVCASARVVCDSRDGEDRPLTFVDAKKLDALEDVLREKGVE